MYDVSHEEVWGNEVKFDISCFYIFADLTYPPPPFFLFIFHSTYHRAELERIGCEN